MVGNSPPWPLNLGVDGPLAPSLGDPDYGCKWISDHSLQRRLGLGSSYCELRLLPHGPELPPVFAVAAKDWYLPIWPHSQEVEVARRNYCHWIALQVQLARAWPSKDYVDRPFHPGQGEQWTGPSYLSWVSVFSLRCHVARHVNHEQRKAVQSLGKITRELALTRRSLHHHIRSLWQITVGPHIPPEDLEEVVDSKDGFGQRMWRLNLTEGELFRTRFLWHFARRYVHRVHYGFWWNDLQSWSRFFVAEQDTKPHPIPQAHLVLQAKMKSLPGIEESQDVRAKAIINLWLKAFGDLPRQLRPVRAATCH